MKHHLPILCAGIILAGVAIAAINYHAEPAKRVQFTQANFEEMKDYPAREQQHAFDDLFIQYKDAKTDDDRAAALSAIRARADTLEPDQVPTDIRSLLNQ